MQVKKEGADEMLVDKSTDFDKDKLGFTELDLDFGLREAIAEAKRCLQCAKPTCITGCPIGNEIPHFIKAISLGNVGEAADIIARRSNLPSVCGRVCPHEKQCEGSCVLNKANKPIKIGKIERVIGDFEGEMGISINKKPRKTRGRVAVIGAGPAGLTVAGDLAKAGIAVTIYEAQKEAGGILMYGIPEFRLSREVVRKEVKKIEQLGVNVVTETLVGKDITIADMLADGYDAVFVGTGTALPKALIIPGKDLIGVMQAVYLLALVTLIRDGDLVEDEMPIKEGDRVIVIGAGNVAVDAARTALRLGASDVKVVYRRTIEAMTALKAEYEYALEEGVEFQWLSSPVEYLGNKKVEALKYEVQEIDEDGNIKGTGIYETLPADKIILAIGQRPSASVLGCGDPIALNERGFIKTKQRPYGMTSRRGIFAGGDVVHEPQTVVLAMKEAKLVAQGIAQYVEAKLLMEELEVDEEI